MALPILFIYILTGQAFRKLSIAVFNVNYQSAGFLFGKDSCCERNNGQGKKYIKKQFGCRSHTDGYSGKTEYGGYESAYCEYNSPLNHDFLPLATLNRCITLYYIFKAKNMPLPPFTVGGVKGSPGLERKQ
jgi:hypothetical protein